MERSTSILQELLDAMYYTDEVFRAFTDSHGVLAANKVGEDVVKYFLGSLERYIQDQRMKLLANAWGGVENGTPEQSEKVTVPQADMIRATGVLGFYNVNRVSLFLYVHAYLLHVLEITPDPWTRMNRIIDDLDPR